MRDAWQRGDPALALNREALARIVAQLVPGARLHRAAPVSGGLANTNWRLELATAERLPTVTLLRFWQRDPAAAAKELALLRCLAGRVAVPRVLAALPADPVFGLPCALLGWIEGQRLEQALAAHPDAAAALGHAAGRALAPIHAVAFDRQGFLDAGLQVATPVDLGQAGLLAWLRRCLIDGIGGARLGPAGVASVLAFAEQQGHLLDHPWVAHPCLTHADFNPSNILVRRAADGQWQVSGVLDWEFAFAGGPSFDLANLLRPPAGARPGFAASVQAGYLAGGGKLEDCWQRRAAIADLYSWVDFLARPSSSDAVLRDAAAMIARIVAGARAGVRA